MFALLCEKMCYCSHREVWWLQLHEEFKVFLTNEKCSDAKLLSSDDWCARLVYLADRFQYLNDMSIECKAKMKISSQVQMKYLDFIQRCSSGDMWKVPTLKCSHTFRNGRMSIVLRHVRQ